MCVVSVVTQAIPQQWGGFGGQGWDYGTAQTLKEILARLDEIDRKLGAKDCTDPNKAAFLKALDDYVEAHKPNVSA